MQIAVMEITNGQVVPQLLKYFGEVQPFVRKLSCKRPLAHSQIASNISYEHSSMKKQRRDRVFNSRAQFAHISFSFGQSRFAILQEKFIEIRIRVSKRQLTCVC